MATINAAVTFTASPRLAASGAFIQKGSARLSAAPSLGVSGTATALAAAPKLAATGRVIKVASATLSASPTLSARTPLVALGATPVLHAAAKVTELASVHLAAAPALGSSATSSIAHLAGAFKLLVPGRAAAVVLSAGTRLVVKGDDQKPGAANLAAAPVLHAAAGVTGQARAALHASPVLAAPAVVTERAAVALHAAPVFTAFFSSASAGLHAQPVLYANAAAIRSARAALSAAAALHAPATVTERAAAALAAHAVLTAAGFRTQRASAALSASPKLAASAAPVRRGSAALSASPALTAAARRFAQAAAALHAAAALSASANATRAVHLSAAPVLHAAAIPSRAGKAALSASPRLTATAHGTAPARSALSAAPRLVAVPIDVIVSQAALAASASLAVAADTRFARPLPPRPPRIQPTWQRDVEHFAIAQERLRHAQALWQYGELVMFCLLWRPRDIDEGRARHCTRCYTPSSVIPVTPQLPGEGAAAEAQISAAYGQGNQYRCSLCYGTQIIAAGSPGVPGVRALIVRPAILTDTDQNQQRTRKGVVNTGSVSIQATPDFRVHTLDYCFRSDGRRYQLAVPGRTTLRTGFATPWQSDAAITYNLMNATLEDPSASVAYVIPPAAGQLAQALGTYTRIPANYAWIEEINGPLIPGENPPPAASGSYQPSTALGGSPPPAPAPSTVPSAGQVLGDEAGGYIADEAGGLLYDEAGI